jgi:primosomal replication protein N
MDKVAEWLQAVEGMLFMGEPVKDMTAGRMLEVIGFLACENEQLQESVMRLEQDKIQAMRSACST